jgi:hypothetical protein
MNKIEDNLVEISNQHNHNMKVTATIDSEQLCGVLAFDDKKFYVDLDIFNKFQTCNKKFSFNLTDIYPSYLYNYKRFSLLEFIFTFRSDNIIYNFKNGNKFDLRKSNVEIRHKYHAFVIERYSVIETTHGHYCSLGNDAYIMKNPMWKILNEAGQEQILMYCETDTLCILCPSSYKKITDYEKTNNDGKKITFYIHQNGYINCSKGLFIHQIITGCHGNGKGTGNISVDHIDQNPLNNTIANLRIATREEQEQNSKGIKEGTKRARNYNAKALPEGITADMMRKYVIYYHEYVNKEKTKSREFFKVETHPKLRKIWIGSKSNKIPILDKLTAANKVVIDLEHDIYPVAADFGLPEYISVKVERGKSHLIYDKKNNDGKRLNMRMVLPDNYVLDEQLPIFQEKIKEKYE